MSAQTVLMTDTRFTADAYPASVASTFGGGDIPSGYKDRGGFWFMESGGANGGTLRSIGSGELKTMLLTRPTGAESGTDQRTEVRFIARGGGNEGLSALVRAVATTQNAYGARVIFGNLYIFKMIGGTVSNLTSDSLSVELVNDDQYRVVLSVRWDSENDTNVLEASVTYAAPPFNSLVTLTVEDAALADTEGVCGVTGDAGYEAWITCIRTFVMGTDFSPGVVGIDLLEADEVRLSGPAPDNATGPVHYRWHRSTTAAFTPDVTTETTGSDQDYIDNTIEQDQTYYYARVDTDDDENEGYSTPVTVAVPKPTIYLGIASDSTWALNVGQNLIVTIGDAGLWLQRLGSKLLGRRIVVINKAVSGKTAQQYVDEELDDAIAEMVTSGATHMLIDFGLNDGGNSIAKASFKASINTIAQAALAENITPIIQYTNWYFPNPRSGREGTAFALVAQDYPAAIEELLDENPEYLAGSRDIFKVMSRYPSGLKDMLHVNEEGVEVQVLQTALALGQALGDFGGGAGGGGAGVGSIGVGIG